MSEQPRIEGDQGDLGDFQHLVQGELALAEFTASGPGKATCSRFTRIRCWSAESPLTPIPESTSTHQQGSKRHGEVPLVPLVPLRWDRTADVAGKAAGGQE